MSMSDEWELIAEIENHIATVNRYLDTLRIGLKNAQRQRDGDTVRDLHGEIQYYTGQLAELKARRAELAQRIKDKRR